MFKLYASATGDAESRAESTVESSRVSSRVESSISSRDQLSNRVESRQSSRVVFRLRPYTGFAYGSALKLTLSVGRFHCAQAPLPRT